MVNLLLWWDLENHYKIYIITYATYVSNKYPKCMEEMERRENLLLAIGKINK